MSESLVRLSLDVDRPNAERLGGLDILDDAIPHMQCLVRLDSGTGQCNVKAYNRNLAKLIHHDRAKPSAIISHELPLSEAPMAYKHFDERAEGWHKVILHPQAAAA